MKNRMNLLFAIGLIFLGCQLKSTNTIEKVKPDNIISEKFELANECEKGINDAINDYKNNDLGLYFYGHPNPRFNTWVRLIREQYDLKIKGGGDIIEEEGECYNKLMQEKIKLKYGNDAFTKIEMKLDSLYEIGLGDRDAEFKEGNPALYKYIYCNIEKELISTNTDEIPIIVVQISINENGAVNNEGILFKNIFAKSHERYEKKVNKLIEDMPNWEPAIVNQKKVKFVYNLPIKFGQEVRNKKCD